MSAPRLQQSQPTRRRHAAARPSPQARRALVWVTSLAVVLFLLATAVIMALTEKLGNNVARVPDAFKGLNASDRPPPAEGLTFLLVGTDTRSDVPTTGTTAGDLVTAGDRGDVLMIARLAADGKSAAVVSIPRDSWVDVPGHGKNKINAAYAFGGPSLLIRTVENLTALHVDHFAVVDFAGFQGVVDSIGGIDVGISAPTRDRGVDFHQGVNHLDGAKALVYVRQRYGLADGDLDRAQRQQNALRSVMTKVASTGTLDDPVGLYHLLDASTEFVSVDDTLTNGGLRGVTQKLRALPPESVSFLRAPTSGPGREGTQSVVYLNSSQAHQLWQALLSGTVAGYVEQHAADALGSVTR